MMNKKFLTRLAGSVVLLLATTLAHAQEAAASAGQTTGSAAGKFYDQFLTNGLLIAGLVTILAAVAAIFHLMNVIIKVQQIQIYQESGLEAYLESVKKPRESFWKRLEKRWTKAVPVEKEEDIMFEHAFDGIQELDNSLPPWWVALFYVTILFAGVYMTYYHFTGMGMSSAEQYERQMERAEEQVQAYLATQANLVDETNVVTLTEEADLAIGKSLYDANCIACHGASGEGGVGPNLADEYWLHGGGIKDIFKTIKYGVPEKGMVAWKTQMGPAEMQKVASYIMTFQGTNPPNGKEPQGERYQVDATPADTSATATDETIGMVD